MRRAPLYALYVADSISLVGNVVAQLAIPWFVLVTTGSATLTGLAVFFSFLPVVLAGIFGGVIVDRLGFRTTSPWRPPAGRTTVRHALTAAPRPILAASPRGTDVRAAS